MRKKYFFKIHELCFLDSLLHGVGLLDGLLPPEHDPGLDDEQNSGDVLEDDPDKGQAEGPGAGVAKLVFFVTDLSSKA
jgi:hypothetical protein